MKVQCCYCGGETKDVEPYTLIDCSKCKRPIRILTNKIRVPLLEMSEDAKNHKLKKKADVAVGAQSPMSDEGH